MQFKKLNNIASLQYGIPTRGGGAENECTKFMYIQPKHIDVGNNYTIIYKDVQEMPLLAKKPYVLQDKDLLFSSRGTYKVSYFEKVKANANYVASASFIVISPKEDIHPLYLKEILNSENMRKAFLKKSDGATIPSISIKELANFEVPVPILDMQIKIAELMSKYKECERILEEKAKLLKQEKSFLLAKLLGL